MCGIVMGPRNKVTLQLRVAEDVVIMLNELKKHYDAPDSASFIAELIKSAHKKMIADRGEMLA